MRFRSLPGWLGGWIYLHSDSVTVRRERRERGLLPLSHFHITARGHGFQRCIARALCQSGPTRHWVSTMHSLPLTQARLTWDVSCSVNDDVCLAILREMDLPTLIAWRAASRTTYLQSVRVLKADLRGAMDVFLPCTDGLLHVLTECGAIIGGEFALNLLLRGDGFRPGRMDIFVNNSTFNRLMDRMKHSSVVAAHVDWTGSVSMTPAYAHTRDISRRETFKTSRGRIIHVYEAFGVSACSVLARSWCTALMNFVGEFSFGCAYPRLTLSRHALVSDLRVSTLADEEYVTMARLIEAGYDLVSEPTQLPPYVHRARPDPPPGIFGCLADLFICPDQGRHFGDGGSMVVFFDPLRGDARSARVLAVAPFGVMAAWRLWSSQSCDANCAQQGGVVPRGMISMPSVFVGGAVFFPTLHRVLLQRFERSNEERRSRWRRGQRRLSL